MEFIRSSEFINKKGISRQRLFQYINGTHRKYVKKNGELMIYFTKPRYKENIHYKWNGGKLLVNKSLLK